MSQGARPEVKAAIVKGAICEALFIVAGIVIYFTTNSLPGLIISVLLGAATMFLILAQAGVFARPNDRA